MKVNSMSHKKMVVHMKKEEKAQYRFHFYDIESNIYI